MSSVLLLFFTKNFRTFEFVSEIPKLDSGMKLISRYAPGKEYVSNAHYKATGTFSFKYVRGWDKYLRALSRECPKMQQAWRDV